MHRRINAVFYESIEQKSRCRIQDISDNRLPGKENSGQGLLRTREEETYHWYAEHCGKVGIRGDREKLTSGYKLYFEVLLWGTRHQSGQQGSCLSTGFGSISIFFREWIALVGLPEMLRKR